MRTMVGLGAVALALFGCSDDTKPPVDSAVYKSEAKVADGPGTKLEGGTADKGGTTADKGGTTADGPAGGGIGPAGGQAKSPDGNFTLDVPAGALTSTVKFEITQPAATPPVTVITTWTKLTTTVKGTSVSATATSTSCVACLEIAAAKKVIGLYQVKPETTTQLPITFMFQNVKITDAGYEIYKKTGDCPGAM